MASNEDVSVKAFVDTQQKFVDFMNQVVGDHEAFKTNASIEQVKVNLSLLTTRIFSKRDWPDTIWPMGDMKLELAELYKSCNNHPQAAIYAIKGCLAETRRSGPQWVDALFRLLQLLYLVVVLGQDGSRATEPGFPSDRHLRDFFHGLLHELALQSQKIFGADTSYNKAVANWYSDAMGSADKPLPGQRGFPKCFDTAQSKVLLWAETDISRRIVLSSSRLS